MNPETRKTKFVAILQELLTSKFDGIQARLAEQIHIRSSRISRWLSGQVDPINLETLVFFRIAMLKGCSNEDLARKLGFVPNNLDSQKKFRLLLKEMLSNKTQEQLGQILGVSQNTISTWLNPEKTIEPSKIPAGTMFAIAHEQGWTFDDLGAYLGLKVENKQNLLIKYQSELSQLPLAQKQELLVWLSNSIKEAVNNSENKQLMTLEDLAQRDPAQPGRTLLIIIEKEDLAIASNYSSNLAIHIQIQPDNIQVVSIAKMPESLEEFDLLIFDISSSDSEAIPLIQNISFDGDIVVFAGSDLAENVRSSLEEKVSEVLLKPIDWSSLKDKEYFR